MADKDTLYHELRDALALGGCPLCRLGSRAGARYLNSMLDEGVNEVQLRDILRAAHGLCRRHAWQLTRRRGAALSTAIVYQDVVRDLLRTLEKQVPAGPAGGRRGAGKALAARLQARRACPACQAEAGEAQRGAGTLLQHLSDPELAAGYQAAGGLCLPHLQAVLEVADDAAAQTLGEWQIQVYRLLVEQTGEVIRKNDYRFRSEPLGAERDSWLRAVASVAGEDDLPPS